jgi:transglutaminase-like putative cysteine protease
MSAPKDRIGILKTRALVLLLCFIFNIFPAAAFASTDDVLIDTGDITRGIINIAYHSDSPQKIKVMIQKGSQRYTYDLRADGSTQSFPLQMGNGDYIISVLKNTQGTKYKYLTKKDVSLALPDQRVLFLNSIQNIDYRNELVADEAQQLTQGLSSDEAKAEAIYHYIVDNCSYDYEKKSTVQAGYIPDPADTLCTKKGICYDYASLFASMARCVGIPCKLVKGYSANVNGYHAWNEVAINGEWAVVDTSSDMQRRAAYEPYVMVKPVTAYTNTYEY